MGSVPINTGQLHSIGPNETYTKKCKECGTENTFTIPKYEIVNSTSVSAVVFSHPEPQYCDKCGKAYQFIIGTVEGVAIGFIGLAKDPRGQIISPPKGIYIPNA